MDAPTTVDEFREHSSLLQNAPIAPSLQEMLRENVLESMPSGLMIVGERGRVLQVNSILASILGFSKDVLLEQGWSVLFIDHPDNEGFNNTLLDVIQKKQIRYKRQVWYSRHDGQRLFLEITSSFLQVDQESWVLVVLVQDLTDLRLMHEREKSALEQKRLAEQQRADSLNNLALSIAHQIRNPIMAIGGFANLAVKNRDDPAKVATFLETVLQSTARLERMAQSVRKYVSIAPGKIQYISLFDVLSLALQRVHAKAEQMNVSLKLSHDSSPQWSIKADPEQLGRALDAVLENALEAYDHLPGQECSIDIAVQSQDDIVALVISDKGRGIPANDLPYVCDPFFTTKAVGSGMGLALVQRILAGHGGLLNIDSRDGEGTEVRMCLPSADADGPLAS